MRDKFGRFVKGHQGYWKGKKLSKKTKRKMSIIRQGSKNSSWKGGRLIDKDGYILIHKPEHPFCDNKGYIREHRLVVEQQINRYLLPREECHHLNKIKDDNRPKNLMAFINKSAHIRFEKGGKVKLSEIIFDGRRLKNGNSKKI